VTPTAVAKTDAEYAADYAYVKRDLTRIVLIALVMFGVIFAAPHLVP